MDIVFDLVSMDVVSSQVDSKVSEVPRLGWCLIKLGTFSEMIFADICIFVVPESSCNIFKIKEYP